MINIPDKLYFKIGEVAELAQIEPYVLRFWQKEFKQLNPRKNSKGQRRFTKKDVELVLQIAHLRYHEKYTIEGIKKLLSKTGSAALTTLKAKSSHSEIKSTCHHIRKEAREILEILNKVPK
ncbi:MerR family transcriptional regulator [candidate division CSSED10-310 bacterium]|uniref:MerR family transcriptional regulator n=1 Tax=candidate division CSSED10-310 bacterium TaxID=2855610 RepID=A0ABV6YVY3_UNCC1